MFYPPKDALGFMTGAEMSKTLVFVRTSCVEQNLMGVKVKSKDAVGIALG
jgi:hypothetical protein